MSDTALETIRILEEKNIQLHQQIYALGKYLANDPDVDSDVCLPQSKAEICPYRLPPYGERDERVCMSCIIRILGTPIQWVYHDEE